MIFNDNLRYFMYCFILQADRIYEGVALNDPRKTKVKKFFSVPFQIRLKFQNTSHKSPFFGMQFQLKYAKSMLIYK